MVPVATARMYYLFIFPPCFTTADRSAVLESRSPAAVWFFSASNCPQCEEISEIFESSAKKLTAWGITVGAVNMDEERKLAKDLRLPKKFPPMLNVSVGSDGNGFCTPVSRVILVRLY